jgi:pSer/pThr/pTyr-binding forkhead associated (FHA) protein
VGPAPGTTSIGNGDDASTVAGGVRAGADPSLLIVIDGPLAGATVPLTGKPITLGRGTSNTVVLDDEFVSSSHARVFLDAETHQWMLEDLSSTNGTYVNESRINGIMTLPARVPVRIGATTFELR